MNYRNTLKNLYAVLRAAREQQQTEAGINMDNWLTCHGCGTAGCLVGSLYIHNPAMMPKDAVCPIPENERPYYRPVIQNERNTKVDWFLAAEQLACSERIADFLFTEHIRGKYSSAKVAVSLSDAEAIRRLEKTIAYLERKQNLWDTDPETLRKQEGDWGFVMEASRPDTPTMTI